jgi:hypothetical protein
MWWATLRSVACRSARWYRAPASSSELTLRSGLVTSRKPAHPLSCRPARLIEDRRNDGRSACRCVKGGIPDRPRNRRQAQRLGGQPVTACSALASREAKPFGELALSAIILGLLGEGLGGGVGEPAPRWALARHERQGARVQAQELIDVAGRQLDRQERRSGW